MTDDEKKESIEMKDSKWAIKFIRQHGMGALCECGKEDIPCLGCQAVNLLEKTINQPNHGGK